MTKVCSKCGETKPLGEFRQRKDRSIPNARCRKCESRDVMRYAREVQPEAKRAADKRYREKHPEKRAAANRAWRAENKLKLRDDTRERMAKWRADNPDRYAEYRAGWRAANKDREMAYTHTRRARVGGVNSIYTSKVELGGPCVYCETAPSTEVDHAIPISRGGTNDDWNLVASCRSCNRSKGNRTLAEWLGFVEPGRTQRS